MAHVSVVIPARNRPDMLREAVESVVAQTFQDVEIIIVLTGATGLTEASARTLQSLHGCKVIVTPPLNLSATRNAGIAQARGEWVSFLDDDDYWAPTKLADQLAAAASTGADVVSVNTRRFDAGGIIGDWRQPGESPIPAGLSYAEALMRDNAVALGSIVRTEIVRRIGGFDETLHGAEDWDFWRRVAQSHEIVYLDQPLQFVRIHGQSMQADRWLMFCAAVAMIYKMRRDTPEHLRHARPNAVRAISGRFALMLYQMANDRTGGAVQRQWHRLRRVAFPRLQASDKFERGGHEAPIE